MSAWSAHMLSPRIADGRRCVVSTSRRRVEGLAKQWHRRSEREARHWFVFVRCPHGTFRVIGTHKTQPCGFCSPTFARNT